MQNVLWRVCNMTLPGSVEYVIIYCGTNDLGHKTAEGLKNIACISKKNYQNLHIFVSCFLPRDDEKSINRSLPLRGKCPYSVFFWSVFSCIWSRKTANTNTFYAVYYVLLTPTYPIIPLKSAPRSRAQCALKRGKAHPPLNVEKVKHISKM